MNPFAAALLITLGVPGLLCSTACSGNKIPRQALAMSGPTLQVRQMSTRRFDTGDEGSVLAACAALLQDTGFNIDNSETDLGLIVGSKDRSAVEAGQVVGKVAVLLLLRNNMPIDKKQRLRASIVTRPVVGGTAVRVSFQRIVWNDQGQISKMELLDDEGAYQEFFDKLSKSLFLQAHHL